MSKQMWEWTRWGNPSRITVVKETDKTAWIEIPIHGGEKITRQQRKDGSSRLFNTFAELKEYEISYRRNQLKEAQRELDRARSELQKAEQMKEPA